MILVPMPSAGLNIVRPLTVYGYDDAPHGHAEVEFAGVRVPASNLLVGEGRGFEIAQGRLGPGRIHHCMRCIGLAESALEAMCDRAVTREAFGQPLARKGRTEDKIALARIELSAARLLVLEAAAKIDALGAKGARKEIAMIKVYVPRVCLRVVDDAMQVFGGAGISGDFVLAQAYANLRT